MYNMEHLCCLDYVRAKFMSMAGLECEIDVRVYRIAVRSGRSIPYFGGIFSTYFTIHLQG